MSSLQSVLVAHSWSELVAFSVCVSSLSHLILSINDHWLLLVTYITIVNLIMSESNSCLTSARQLNDCVIIQSSI